MSTSERCTQASLWWQRRRLIVLVSLAMLSQLLIVGFLSAAEPLPPIDTATADPVVAQAAHYNYYLAEADADEDEGDEEDEKSDVIKRLEKLEENYGDLEEDYSKLSDNYNDLKKKMKVTAFSGHGDATMKVNGRIHADMWSFPGDSLGVNILESGDPNVTPQDRVGFRRMRFGVKGKLAANMEYKIEMEFAGGNDSEFRDAYLGWNDLPVFHTV
ncbi:MAG: porin, partial [Lacipirellulaceae bacterium]